MNKNRYPDNWGEIAFKIKEKVNWQCSKCGMQCVKPGEDTKGLNRSERMRRTLVVHHANYIPEDNKSDNLIPLCSGCHLGFHTRRKANVPPGQLSLFDNH